MNIVVQTLVCTPGATTLEGFLYNLICESRALEAKNKENIKDDPKYHLVVILPESLHKSLTPEELDTALQSTVDSTDCIQRVLMVALHYDKFKGAEWLTGFLESYINEGGIDQYLQSLDSIDLDEPVFVSIGTVSFVYRTTSLEAANNPQLKEHLREESNKLLNPTPGAGVVGIIH